LACHPGKSRVSLSNLLLGSYAEYEKRQRTWKERKRGRRWMNKKRGKSEELQRRAVEQEGRRVIEEERSVILSYQKKRRYFFEHVRRWICDLKEERVEFFFFCIANEEMEFLLLVKRSEAVWFLLAQWEKSVERWSIEKNMDDREERVYLSQDPCKATNALPTEEGKLLLLV
jgi:hypothetical protein